ncbi:helix-turn-helix domain containing protein [Streptomyces coeruleorubidus]|uniref:TetR/AcrR family transcriptional regulator n=1 Tax=Streptomyces coeruleorubidus TaxID=116188 RepID=UPI00237F9E36|nr:TetR/AcrR family transcriptional regulator [Streptomyces coeruleorubidus]WDV49964.1 helix-turn-helix domain containing protein [Streptomyces coeruleorubidus]
MEDLMVDSGRTPRRGRPPVSDEQRGRQRLDISRHAVRLFAEQGVAATSGEQIARAAGVSERTLWRYFPTKESCVEPLLRKMLDAFRTVLHAWPSEAGLIEHLRTAYQPVLDSSSEDVEAVLAVIRMTHDEPALRAAYLVLRERAEETFTEVLAERMAMPPETFEVRVQAATMNAVLKVAADEFARETADRGITPEVLNDHREQLAHALGLVTRRLSGTDAD